MLVSMLSAALRAEADAHIDRLAARHHIRVRRSRKRDFWTAEADVPTRQVFIPQLRVMADYFAALHEIGHIVDRSARARFNRQHTTARARRTAMVMEESAAWAWAFDQALPSLRRSMTAADWRRIGGAWVSYAH